MSDGWRFEKLNAEEKDLLASMIHHMIFQSKAVEDNIQIPIQFRAKAAVKRREMEHIFEVLFTDGANVTVHDN